MPTIRDRLHLLNGIAAGVFIRRGATTGDARNPASLFRGIERDKRHGLRRGVRCNPVRSRGCRVAIREFYQEVSNSHAVTVGASAIGSVEQRR
jgi:hypothetical protein